MWSAWPRESDTFTADHMFWGMMVLIGIIFIISLIKQIRSK